MAVLLSCATGNWLTAGTWGLVDSTSYLNSETASTAITTSYVASSTFTPGAITIDAIAIKIATRTATIGTLSVALDLATVTVAGTEVTINVADLNAFAAASLDGGWVVFKFASPVTLAAATAYGVKIKTSSASQVTAFSSATTNWSRALRTTTTQAPVAGDDTIVVGEHTGAGTGNNFTITMNETATTDYGSNATSTVTPALAICKRGTLKFNDASAANPKLRLSGHAIVYNGGTLNIGTVATPIPRDSTAVLEFDCTADGDFGLVCRNGSTTTLQGLSRTSGKNVIACKLAADASASGGAPSTSTLTIDTDTGWLSGDQVAIAATSRTATDCETGTLTTDAGVSSIVVNNMTAGVSGTAVPPTSNRGLLVAHSGISPTQAEIILLARNVKVRSTSATAMSYVLFDCAAAAGTTSVDVDWAEFYFLGEAVTNKRGVEVSYISTFAGSINVQYSSIHDCEDNGVYLGTNILNTTFSNNVMWNLATIAGPACQIAGASAATNWVIDNNILIRNSSSTGWTLSDIGGTFTNNVMAGSAGAGLSLAETATIGTMAGNSFHANAGLGVQFAINGIAGTFGSCVSWRNNGGGISLVTNIPDLILDSPVCFGNAAQNLLLVSGDAWIKSPVFNGDSTFSTAAGITFTTVGASVALLIDNGDFSTVSGIKTAHTIADINISASQVSARAVLRNTKLGGSSEIGTLSGNLTTYGFVASQKHDQIAGNHKTWMKNGTIQTDATIYNTNAPSLLMTPTSATLKLESAPQFQGLKVAVNNGSAATVSCYVKERAENLFSYSEDFSQVVWSPQNATMTTGQTDPLGGTTSTRFLETANSTSQHGQQRIASMSTTNGATYTWSFHAKGVGRQWLRLVENNRSSWVDLTNGIAGTLDAAHAVTVASDANGFYRIKITFAANTTSLTPALYSAPADNNLGAFTGDITKGFVSWGWQFESGAAAGPYQPTTISQPGYNGNHPRLIQKANPALGQNADVVLATLVGGTGSWIQMSGTTSTATDDGAWEIVVDCDGTAGAVNVDDFAVS